MTKQTPAEIWLYLREDKHPDYTTWVRIFSSELRCLLDAIEPFIYNTSMKDAMSGALNEELWRVVSSEVEQRNEQRR